MRQRSALPQVHPRDACVDSGAHTHFVTVPPGAHTQGQDVREFEAFTADVCALADWLTACAVTTVAMESTGPNRIPLLPILEGRQFEVPLVDPRRVKHAPCRKTDVLDCQ